MPRGGKRVGAGLPKGYKFKKTLDKEASRERTRALITAEIGPMLFAQIAHAKGLSYLVAREVKTGKFKKLTEELAAGISDGTNEDYEAIEVWAKDPSIQAFTDLMNRALDKPKDQPQDLNVNIGASQALLDRLDRWRLRSRTDISKNS